MTGFGSASAEFDGARCTVEVRSVNNRFYKSSMRLPSQLESLEPDIDATVMRRLARGSVTIAVRWTEVASRSVARIN
ncbi:MAG: YicC/YloC family endoribonuclease, partial [Phycisphaerales bacterium]